MLHPAEFGFGREERVKAEPGTFVYGPRGVPHGFEVNGTAPARILLQNYPAGFEGFPVEVGEPAEELTIPALYNFRWGFTHPTSIGKVVSARMTTPTTSYLRPLAALVALVAAMGALLIAYHASPSHAAPVCSTTSGTTTCTFSSTGAEDTFVVPAGVSSVQVVAIGAPGAAGGIKVAPPVAVLG